MIDKLLFFVIGVYFFYQGFFFPPSLPGIQSAVFWPRLLAIALMALALFPKKYFVERENAALATDKPVKLAILVCVYYFLTWYFLGFIFATLTSVFIYMLILREGQRRMSAALAYAVTYFVFIYLFFHVGMRVPL